MSSASVKISRREFIYMAGAALAGGFLSACTRSALSPVLDSTSGLEVTPSPSPTDWSLQLSPSATSSPVEQPTQTPFQKAVPTPTRQLSPTSAGLPEPSSTPSDKATAGLSAAQKKRLATVSLGFVARTETEAIQVARSLGYIKNDGHPASVCGPLAAAILREAGLISPYTNLHDFWLLDPRLEKSRLILENTFPSEEFFSFRTTQSTAEFDFTAFPLKEGDFVYLYAGRSGSFEHMLIVTRIDEQGRAFSVTNFLTPEGYVIDEVMLYDPGQAGTGKLYDWTDWHNARLGRTGYGGFELWRFRVPVVDPTPDELALAADIDAIIDRNGGDWHILMKAVDGKTAYSRRPRESLHPASTIKVPIAMLFFKVLEKWGVRDLPEALKKGPGSRSYEQLLRAMLVESEELATDTLLESIRQSGLDTLKTLAQWGARRTDIYQRSSSAWDIALLFEGMYSKNFISAEARTYILDLLSFYTPGDDLRLGVIRHFLPSHSMFYNKRGTITAEQLVVADVAIIHIPASSGRKTYLAAVFGYRGSGKARYEDLEKAIGEMAVALWHYIQKI